MEEAALLETHTSGGGGSGTDTAPRSSFQSSSSPSPGGLCCDHGTREKPQRLPEPASKEPARSSEARPRRWPRGAEMELGVPGWELRRSPHPTPHRPRRLSCRQLLGGGERPCRKGAGSRVCRRLDCGWAEWRRRRSGRRWRSHPAWRRGREHLLGMSSGLCQRPTLPHGPPRVLPGTVVVSLSSAAHETLVFVFNVTVARTWVSSPLTPGSSSADRICCFVDLS